MHGSFLTEPTVSYARLQTQMRLHVGMSFEEILEELPKLTADEKERLRQLLDYQLSWTEAEEQAIDEGIRSREEGPSMPWEELDGPLRQRFTIDYGLVKWWFLYRFLYSGQIYRRRDAELGKN